MRELNHSLSDLSIDFLANLRNQSIEFSLITASAELCLVPRFATVDSKVCSLASRKMNSCSPVPEFLAKTGLLALNSPMFWWGMDAEVYWTGTDCLGVASTSRVSLWFIGINPSLFSLISPLLIYSDLQIHHGSYQADCQEVDWRQGPTQAAGH